MDHPIRFDPRVTGNPALLRRLFDAARRVNPKIDAYVGTRPNGDHVMQAWGVADPVIVTQLELEIEVVNEDGFDEAANILREF